MEAFKFVINGRPATKKNSQQMVRGRSIILPSKAYSEYCSKFHRQLRNMKQYMELPHYTGPVAIKCLYWLDSKAHYPDLIGLEQATADILSDEYKTVNHKKQLSREWVLADDRIIKSWDGSRIAGIDKERPRVEIEIVPLEVTADETDPYILKQASDSQKLF